ncbi:MAG: hypothetical protein OXT70_01140 [Chloroflexota bacterium]|nr:hypothetical protein [Chloroflexota bacterium]
MTGHQQTPAEEWWWRQCSCGCSGGPHPDFAAARVAAEDHAAQRWLCCPRVRTATQATIPYRVG